MDKDKNVEKENQEVLKPYKFEDIDLSLSYNDKAKPQSFEKDKPHPKSFKLTLLSEPEGKGILSGAGEYPVGTLVNITAMAASAKYVFDFWEYDGIVFTGSPYMTFLLEEDLTLTAHFIESKE